MSSEEGVEQLEHCGIQKPVKFNPYSFNCGPVAAIAGENYVLIASDTRLSVYNTIFTRNQKKLTQLTDKVVVGISGCWADAKTVIHMLIIRLKQYQYEHGRIMSLPAIAQMLSTMLYYKRFFPYYVLIILAGFDNEGEGWVYRYDALGSFEKCKYSSCGTGEVMFQPLMDSFISKNNNAIPDNKALTKETAMKLLKDMFMCAAERDIYTGDNVQIMSITRYGIAGIQEENFTLRKD